VKRTSVRGCLATATGLIALLISGCAVAPPAPERNAAESISTSSSAEKGVPGTAADRGSTDTSVGTDHATVDKRGLSKSAAQNAARANTAEATSPESEAGRTAKPRIFRGTDEVLAPAPPRAAPAATAQDVSFKFEQAPVREVVHVVLGELLGLTYVLHQPIAGTVTVSTAAPIPANQALSVLEAVLQANGLLMAQDGAGVFHVGPPDALRGVVPAPKRIEQVPLPPGFGTVIVPLKFIGAAEMAEILRPIARPEAFMRVDTVRNLLFLAGTRNQIEGWLEIVRTFDVDLLKGMSVGVFPLQYASVRDIDAALRAVSPSGDTAAPSAPGAAAGAAAAPTALARQPLLGALRVIPLERLNSLLVITPRAEYLDEVKKWIERLDRPSDTDAEPRLFVYPVQNGSAQHLASVLNGIFGGGGTGAAGAGDSGVAPGLRSVTGMSAPSARSGAQSSALPSASSLGGGAAALGLTGAQQPGARGGTGGGVTSVTLASNVRIVGDDLNNAVIIYAPPAEFRKIESTLRRLDAPATQVLIEATIAEVTLTDELQYGLQWYFTDTPRTSSGLRGTGQLNLNTQGAIGPIQPGFSYTLTNAVGQVRAVLNALADRSLIRVISSPSLMVLDNHTAAISVGDQQPIQSTETVTAGGNVTTSIQYKDTGVLLSVTPSVNSGDVVSMSISQAVTDVGAIDSATGQRAFLQRQIGTRVAVRSGEALVLGGLIRDNATAGSSGLPFLSRIPVIGALFGSQTQIINRTELLIVITPRVVRTPQDAKEIAIEMRERMRGIRSLAEEQRDLLPRALMEGVPAKRDVAPSREVGKP